MIRLDEQLEARKATLRQVRDGKHLFVWGDIGQWLVVDAEAAALLECFAERRAVGEALKQYARIRSQRFEDVVAVALPVIEALKQRDLLGSSLPIAALPDERPRVSNLTFNITNRCNLRCPWCYNPRSIDEEVPVDVLLNWLDDPAGCLDHDAAFIILGGEPFLNERRLLDTVAGVRQRLSGEILISTNGTHLTAGVPQDLAAAGATVQISLDSPSPERHDAIRGAGVFDRAIHNARRLADAGVPTIFSMVLTQSSQQDIEPYFDLARAAGAKEVRFIPLRQIGCGAGYSDQIPDLYGCFRQIVAILERRPALAGLLHRDFFSILMTVCRFSRLRSNCGIARRCLFVDADGAVYPCPNHRQAEHACGNVRTSRIGDILQSSPVMDQFRTQYRLENMPACSGCAFRYWCAGDCRAEALVTGGDPGAPSPYCRDLQRIIPDMFWLIAAGWSGLADPDRSSHVSASTVTSHACGA